MTTSEDVDRVVRVNGASLRPWCVHCKGAHDVTRCQDLAKHEAERRRAREANP